MALPAGRKGVLPSEITPEGKLKVPQPESELPEYSSSDAGKVLEVNSEGALEFATPQASGKIYMHMFHDGLFGINRDEVFVLYTSDPTPISKGEILLNLMRTKGFVAKDKFLPAIGKDIEDTQHPAVIGLYLRNESPTDNRAYRLLSNLSTGVWDINGNIDISDFVVEL